MDFKEILKKYWFVGLVAILLAAFIAVYIADEKKNEPITIDTKVVDGKYVICSVDGQDLFADDIYPTMYQTNGLSCEFVQFQRQVLNAYYDTTDEMSLIASNNANQAYQYYSQSYSIQYLANQLQSFGYTGGINDLNQYYIDAQKRDLLLSDFLSENFDKYCKEYCETEDPRVIYHILVKVADITQKTDENGNTINVANPTKEEQTKLDNILEALKEKDFANVASSLSDDTGTAINGGLLGVVTNTSKASLDQTFADECFKLKDDEVSEVITSQFGYHIIWNAGSSKDILVKDQQFLEDIEQQNANVSIIAIMEKAKEKNFEIVDPELLAMVELELGSEE